MSERQHASRWFQPDLYHAGVSLRAGIYLRISEDRTGEGLATDRQREDCEALIRHRGWHPADTYRDNDISAAGRKKRPEFARLLADIHARRIAIVVAWALDRLVRTARDRLALVEACRSREVSVALVQGADMDMTTAAGRLYVGVLGEVAQHEIDVKGERQRRQLRQAAEAGQPGAGPRAFGYQQGGREIDAVEAALVRQIYSRFLAGSALVELAQWLNLQGVPTPKGKRWRPGSIKVVLANPRNAGLRGVRPVVDEATGRRSPWHEIVGPSVWPGIVDEPTWRAAVTVLRDPARQIHTAHHHGRLTQRLLSGITWCGRCGLPMIASSGNGGRRVYRCSSKMHIVRDAAMLEKYVTAQILDRLGRRDAADLLTAPSDGGDLELLRIELLSHRAELQGLAADYDDGFIDRDQLRVASQKRRGRIGELETRIAELGRLDVLGPLVEAGDVIRRAQMWLEYPVGTRRQVIARLVRVEVLQGRPGRPRRGVFDPSTVRLRWIG